MSDTELLKAVEAILREETAEAIGVELAVQRNETRGRDNQR
jgi:hypothetical protein